MGLMTKSSILNATKLPFLVRLHQTQKVAKQGPETVSINPPEERVPLQKQLPSVGIGRLCKDQQRERLSNGHGTVAYKIECL